MNTYLVRLLGWGISQFQRNGDVYPCHERIQTRSETSLFALDPKPLPLRLFIGFLVIASSLSLRWLGWHSRQSETVPAWCMVFRLPPYGILYRIWSKQGGRCGQGSRVWRWGSVVGPYECGIWPWGSIGERLLASQKLNSFMTSVDRVLWWVVFRQSVITSRQVLGSVKSPILLVQGAISSEEKQPNREAGLLLKRLLRLRMYRHVFPFRIA
jgi:hypothetical protein